METLGFSSTGTLNYNLKVLGDLLSKDDTEKYLLSEKGKLACRILTEFPDENNQLQKRKRQKQFWTASALSQIIYLGSDVEKSRLKKAYIMSGGLAGLVIAFFGTAFLTFISVRLAGPNFMRILNETWEVLVLASVLVVLGSVAGYFAGKRNKFEKPKWITKIDEKFGF